MTLDFPKLFEQFVRHKKYVCNYADNTITSFHAAWKKYTTLVGTEVTREGCTEFVVRMREAGVSPATVNFHIKSFNSFLRWLHEFGYMTELVNIKTLKKAQKIVQPVPDETIKKIINWRPRLWSDRRVYALLCLLIDTGVRIEEALTLQRESVDLDNLLIKVRGKGSKERLIPFSLEYRKILYKWLQAHDNKYVFPNYRGGKWHYRNVHRVVQDLMDRLGCEHIGLHRFRHSFATNYLRGGGNILYLQRQLGHSSLQSTKIYVKVETEDLQREHAKLSPLSRLR